ncbi:MAG: 30S ribosomal protein S6 [Coriobacteriia bacterium]|nr:30S ribosomal protein S6 [Coriobacteriia bacterium]
MKAYELLYFVAPSADDKPKKLAYDRIESTLKEIKGKIDNVEDLGKMNLAYEIDGANDGDYTLIDFHCDPAGIAELNRVLRLTVEVQRHMIVARKDRD